MSLLMHLLFILPMPHHLCAPVFIILFTFQRKVLLFIFILWCPGPIRLWTICLKKSRQEVKFVQVLVGHSGSQLVALHFWQFSWLIACSLWVSRDKTVLVARVLHNHQHVIIDHTSHIVTHLISPNQSWRVHDDYFVPCLSDLTVIYRHVVFSTSIQPGRGFSPFGDLLIALENRGKRALAIKLHLIDQSHYLEIACEYLRLKTLTLEKLLQVCTCQALKDLLASLLRLLVVLRAEFQLRCKVLGGV